MPEALHELREKVALSCRILAMEGLVEGILGHVSARIAGSHEMLIRCRSNEECGVLFTKVSDIRRVDWNGLGPGLGEGYEVPKELPIHGEIYKVRPEVGCVIHVHPPAVLICGIANLEFRPIFGVFNIPAMRMALEGIPIFARSLLVTRPDLAVALIESMGQKHICLMKGHGITVTGATVEEATVRALNFNILAKVTLQVAQTGRQAVDIVAEAVSAMSEAVRQELVGSGVRVTLIEPGVVDTPFYETRRNGVLASEDIARAVMFAVSQPKHVNVNEMLVRYTDEEI